MIGNLDMSNKKNNNETNYKKTSSQVTNELNSLRLSFVKEDSPIEQKTVLDNLVAQKSNYNNEVLIPGQEFPEVLRKKIININGVKYDYKKLLHRLACIYYDVIPDSIKQILNTNDIEQVHFCIIDEFSPNTFSDALLDYYTFCIFQIVYLSNIEQSSILNILKIKYNEFNNKHILHTKSIFNQLVQKYSNRDTAYILTRNSHFKLLLLCFYQFYTTKTISNPMLSNFTSNYKCLFRSITDTQDQDIAKIYMYWLIQLIMEDVI